MAVLATTHPTLADVAKRLDPNGNIADVVEILNETNEVLTDMVWLEANERTGHRTTIRTGLPQGTWRKLYGGVQPGKSSTAQVTDNCGMLEAYAEVDKALVDLSGNTAAFRLSEDKAFIEGMSQQMADTVFYGNEGTEPASFTGTAPRFNSLSAANADNIIDAGGSGSDNTSVWMMVWGDRSVHGIYPKGSKAGLQVTDKGQVTIESIDGAGGRMEAYRTHYRWDCGLSVRDWRYIVRACNIDRSNLLKDAASGADLVDIMTDMMHRTPNLTAGRPVFYMNRDVISFLDRQMKNAKNINISVEQLGGKRTLMFGGVPVRRCDAILNSEARVT
jgi:hypothetical protein